MSGGLELSARRAYTTSLPRYYDYRTSGDAMLNQLRGRNLTHIGCTLGIVIGMTLGMFAAIGIFRLVQSTSAPTLAFATLVAATVVLGGVGFYVGGRLSRPR